MLLFWILSLEKKEAILFLVLCGLSLLSLFLAPQLALDSNILNSREIMVRSLNLAYQL